MVSRMPDTLSAVGGVEAFVKGCIFAVYLGKIGKGGQVDAGTTISVVSYQVVRPGCARAATPTRRDTPGPQGLYCLESWLKPAGG